MNHTIYIYNYTYTVIHTSLLQLIFNTVLKVHNNFSSCDIRAWPNYPLDLILGHFELLTKVH